MFWEVRKEESWSEETDDDEADGSKSPVDGEGITSGAFEVVEVDVDDISTDATLSVNNDDLRPGAVVVDGVMDASEGE